MNDHPWKLTRFAIPDGNGGAKFVGGYVWRGLGLCHHGWGTPRTETLWSLIHLGSGGTFLHLTGNVLSVFPVASEIAECADFTLFDLPEGWRQTDPEMPAKMAAIVEQHPEIRPSMESAERSVTDDDARAVIAANAELENA